MSPASSLVYKSSQQSPLTMVARLCRNLKSSSSFPSKSLLTSYPPPSSVISISKISLQSSHFYFCNHPLPPGCQSLLTRISIIAPLFFSYFLSSPTPIHSPHDKVRFLKPKLLMCPLSRKMTSAAPHCTLDIILNPFLGSLPSPKACMAWLSLSPSCSLHQPEWPPFTSRKDKVPFSEMSCHFPSCSSALLLLIF